MKTTNLGALVLSAVMGCSEPETPLQTMTIDAEAVRIHEGNPYDTSRTQYADVNYAGQPVMVGSSAEDGFSRALVSIPLEALAGKQIESAKLYVTIGQTAMSSYDNTVCGLEMPLEIKETVISWDLQQVTWSDVDGRCLPSVVATQTVSVPCGSTKTAGFDIAHFVQSVAAGGYPSNGLVILAQNDTDTFRQEQIARHGGKYWIGRAVQVDAVLSDFKVEVEYR